MLKGAKERYLERKGDTIELLLSTMVNELIRSEADDPVQHLLTMLQERRGLPPAPGTLPAPSSVSNDASTQLRKELDQAKDDLAKARAEVSKYKQQALQQARSASVAGEGGREYSEKINRAREAALNAKTDEKFKEWSVSAWIGKRVGDRMQRALLQPLTQKSPEVNPSQALEFMRLLGEEGAVHELLTDADLLDGITDDVNAAVVELSGGTGSVLQLSKKFAENTFELSYGDLPDFFSGLEGVIGPPDPKLLNAMYREHCVADDSSDFFVSTNYAVETTSSIEWYYVNDPQAEGREHLKKFKLDNWPAETSGDIPIEHRRFNPPGAPKSLKDFDKDFERINRELKRMKEKPLLMEELIGGRMYTGPLFIKYNLVLRAKPKAAKHEGDYAKKLLDDHARTCKGNLYATTIHVLNSCIVKLSKLTKVGKVYRGLADGALPKRFFEPNEYNVKGGVEPAFMSTTADEKVAHAYASTGKGGIILALEQGMVSRGAELSWLSQYPHEKEVLFAPLTGIEKKDAHVYQGKCIVVDMALSVNLTTPTIDEVVGKMQNSFIGMVRSMKDDLHYMAAPEPTLEPLDKVLTDTRQRGYAYFNVAELFEKATSEALAAKDRSIHLLGEPGSWPKHDGDKKMKERMQLAAHHCASEENPDVAAKILIMMEQRFPSEELFERVGREGRGQETHATLVKEITDGRKNRMQKEKKDWPSDEEFFALVAASCLLKSGIAQRNPWPLVLIKLCEIGGDPGAATRIAKAHNYPATITEGQLFYKDATVIARKSNRLLQAAGMGDVAGIKEALDDMGMGDDAMDQSADNGMTPLMLASHENAVEAVEFLLLRRADPKLKSSSGCTALTVAVDRKLPGAGDVVKKLVDAKADVNAKTSQGLAAIHKACNLGIEDAITALIAGKADVNLRGDGGWTPLMMAGQNGHVNICKLLIDENADVDARNDKPGTTALIDAAYSGQEEVVKLLLEAGVKAVDAADDYGDTAVACAVSSGHGSIIKLLIDHKADVNKADKKGRTPLTRALKQIKEGWRLDCYKPIVEMLKAAGGTGEAHKS